MPNNLLEKNIRERGKEFFTLISSEKPSLFNKGEWVGRVMDWCMKNETFKVNMFRFVDVFPYLSSGRSLTRHIKEYFGESRDVPTLLKWGARSSTLFGGISSYFLNFFIRINIKSMARQFIVGETSKEAIGNMLKLRKNGFTCILDLLGESTITEEEAIEHQKKYITLLQDLEKEQDNWHTVGSTNPKKDWGYGPKTQISVKATALYSQIKPEASEASINHILERLKPVYEQVIKMNASMCIDMESSTYKNLTLEVFKRLRSNPRYKNYPHLGIVLQAYLTETEDDAKNLIQWAKNNNLSIEIRLVKGAYWDYETVVAAQNTWIPPVWLKKKETDAAFERIGKIILENHEHCYLACGSHNIRSISAILEIAKSLNVPEDRYEFQVLYGMGEPVRKALLKIGKRVRLYCPYGDMIPGMAYLVRRLLENTANESFLRQSFVEDAKIDKLLENPAI